MDASAAALVPAEIVADDAQEALDRREYDRALEHHRRHCKVCRHSDLADIEALYCGWLDPSKVARAYGLDVDVLQRHAARFGWHHERVRNVETLLAQLAENAMRKLVPPGEVTLDTVLAITDRLQRGQMHLAGAPRKVERALRTGRQPAPVKTAEGRTQTWERMIRETRTVSEPAEPAAEGT